MWMSVARVWDRVALLSQLFRVIILKAVIAANVRLAMSSQAACAKVTHNLGWENCNKIYWESVARPKGPREGVDFFWRGSHPPANSLEVWKAFLAFWRCQMISPKTSLQSLNIQTFINTFVCLNLYDSAGFIAVWYDTIRDAILTCAR